MAASVENNVKESVVNHRRGKIFFPANFSKFGPSASIRHALTRLTEKGFLIRLASGIYLYPKQHKLLGTLFPSNDEIAVAISKRDKARIIPTGIQALNKLGLSTQIPMNVVYLTDGSARTIQLEKGNIKFKKASPKALSIKDDMNLLIIQALKEIGNENLDIPAREKINELLKTVSPERIRHDMKLAPSWIAEIMQSSIKD